MRPALFVVLIAVVVSCGAPARPGPAGAPVVSALAEEELSLEVSALM